MRYKILFLGKMITVSIFNCLTKSCPTISIYVYANDVRGKALASLDMDRAVNVGNSGARCPFLRAILKVCAARLRGGSRRVPPWQCVFVACHTSHSNGCRAASDIMASDIRGQATRATTRRGVTYGAATGLGDQAAPSRSQRSPRL